VLAVAEELMCYCVVLAYSMHEARRTNSTWLTDDTADTIEAEPTKLVRSIAVPAALRLKLRGCLMTAAMVSAVGVIPSKASQL
jgi:hypothetical protein